MTTQPVDFSKTPISAVFVFHDPRNWSLDIQIICDVIQSNGIIGGPYDLDPADQQPQPTHKNTPDVQRHKPVELIFCNPDLLWRSEFERPRLGQGAFREAFQAVYKARPLPFYFGELSFWIKCDFCLGMTGFDGLGIPSRTIWKANDRDL